MRIIAVDDEKLALESLVSAIENVAPSGQVCGFRNALRAEKFVEEHPCDIAFLDIEMREMDGVTLAKKMKLIRPNINIIFTTGYGEYRKDALDMHASGYIEKPVTEEKIKREMDELRHPIVRRKKTKKLKVRTFGNFEVYAGLSPMKFRYNKSKELLAYLIDRNGTLCSNREIMSVLWEDEEHISYMKNSRADLIDVLKKNNYEDVIVRQWGKLGILPEKLDCDYFDWLKGDPKALNTYRGEYMSQYSWAELTHATIEEKL